MDNAGTNDTEGFWFGSYNGGNDPRGDQILRVDHLLLVSRWRSRSSERY